MKNVAEFRDWSDISDSEEEVEVGGGFDSEFEPLPEDDLGDDFFNPLSTKRYGRLRFALQKCARCV
jgi:hypothetical protein